MKTRLTKGLDERDQEIERENFHKALGFRKRMIDLLNEEIDGLHASMRDEDGFNNPNWAYVQADRVAQVKALRRIISLLS